MTLRRKPGASLSGLSDGFKESVNKTGSTTPLLTALIFIAGGLLSTYVGYTDAVFINLIGGPFAILIGILILARAGTQNRKKRRKKQQSRTHNTFMRSSDQG